MANETLDPSNQSEGDTKEGIYIGQEIPADSEDAKLPLHGPNQWPREVSSLSEQSLHRMLEARNTSQSLE